MIFLVALLCNCAFRPQETGLQLWHDGDHKGAYKYFTTAVDVTPELATATGKFLESKVFGSFQCHSLVVVGRVNHEIVIEAKYITQVTASATSLHLMKLTCNWGIWRRIMISLFRRTVTCWYGGCGIVLI